MGRGNVPIPFFGDTMVPLLFHIDPSAERGDNHSNIFRHIPPTIRFACHKRRTCTNRNPTRPDMIEAEHSLSSPIPHATWRTSNANGAPKTCKGFERYQCPGWQQPPQTPPATPERIAQALRHLAR
jgi:hypothetical protein